MNTGGVSVSGDIECVVAGRLPSFAEQVKQCAGSVSAMLGFDGRLAS